MKIRRINENTISCIISPEDMSARGIRLDDFFERKKEAVDFIRSTVAQAAISENFDLQGEFTTMRVSVLPDHSLSLLITREDTKEGAAREVRRIAKSIFESLTSKASEKDGEGGQEKSASDRLIEALFPGADSSSSAEKEGASADRDKAAGEKVKAEGEDGEKAPYPADAFMFSFYTVRDAMDCCRLFANAGPVDSSLYYLREDDIYFLIIKRNGRTPGGLEKWALSANEFGELVTSYDQYISYVTEHGICIAKGNAIEMFMDVLPDVPVPKIRKKAGRKSRGENAADPGTGAEAPAADREAGK
ncbi:MAG: adaptor protein MecA [Sarcina sp.]|nr:adaptor protein MecA [Sarcina sp.]